MRIFVVLAAVLVSTVAAPTDCDGESTAPSEPIVAPADPTVHYRKETLDQISRNTTADHVQTSTKAKEKIKIKHLKNGGTKEIIVDTSRTKTKKDFISDEYSQTNDTLTEDGLEDSLCLAKDHQHEVKEIDVVKKKDKEVIIRDKYGNIISDTKKSKTKEKAKKKEKDLETSTLIHTVKKVDPADVPVPCSDDAPSTPPQLDC